MLWAIAWALAVPEAHPDVILQHETRDVPSFFLVDADYDGTPDVVTAESWGSSGNHDLYLSSAGGLGSTPVSIPSFGFITFTVDTGDFNGDGLEDVVLNDASRDQARIGYADGRGGWLYGTSAPAFWYNFVSTVGDLNADGFDDLALYDSTGDTKVYLGGPAGLDMLSPQVFRASVTTFIGDLNCDGYDDLVEDTGYTMPTQRLFWGNALGVPVDSGLAYVSQVGERYLDVWPAGDVNGDGCDDITVTEAKVLPRTYPTGYTRDYIRRTAVYVVWGSTTGPVLGPQLRALPMPDDEIGSKVTPVGDFDNDGYDDFVVGSHRVTPANSRHQAGALVLFRGGPNTVSPAWIRKGWSEEGQLGWAQVWGADINNDGYSDVITRNGDAERRVEVFWGTPHVDDDGDGWFNVEDCADDDPTIYPGAPDDPTDGRDTDCGGWSDFDRDEDGVTFRFDCDDNDPTVYPENMVIRYGDGIDQDCNGADEFPEAFIYGTPNEGATVNLAMSDDDGIYRAYFYSLAGPGAGPCPTQLRGTCLDLIQPTLVGTATEVYDSVRLELTMPAGTEVWVQGVGVYNGRLVKAPPVSTVVQVPPTP